jgi:hypothetical protein
MQLRGQVSEFTEMSDPAHLKGKYESNLNFQPEEAFESVVTSSPAVFSIGWSGFDS